MSDERWPTWLLDVDARVNALPLELRETLRPLLADIGRPRNGDPRCSNLLFDADATPRVLAQLGWALDDLGVARDDRRADVERTLFVAGFLVYASSWIRHATRDPAIRLPLEAEEAARALFREGRLALAALCGEGSVELGELDAADAVFERTLDEAFGGGAPAPEAITQAAQARWSASAVLVRAAARALGRGDGAGAMAELVASYARSAQLRAELVYLQNDAVAGRRTGPITLLSAESGCALAGVQAGLVIAGTTLTSSRLARWVHVERERLREALERARRLAATRLGAALAAIDAELEEIASVTGIACELEPDRPPPRVDPTPDLADAVQRARSALLADPTMRESWEVHRWGFFDRPELTARNFPMALVIEHLAAAGVDASALVDPVLRDYRASEYLAFDEPSPMPPDIDTLGAMMRIGAYAADLEGAAEILATPLTWVRASMPVDGDVPVWLLEGPRDDTWPSSFTTLIGAYCVGCQVHLALGLLAQRSGPLGPVAEPLLAPLVGAIAKKLASSGAALSVFYGVPYLAYVVSRLSRSVAGHPGIDAGVCASLRGSAARLVADLEALADRSHQDAALLLLVTSGDADPRWLRAPWLDRVLRAQRYDGTFDAVPLYLLPRRGSVSAWYSSRLVTTAICHHALALARATHAEELS